MGAVSGLVDIPDPPATLALIDAMANLKPKNRDLALNGLLRSEPRMLALLDAIAAGRITRDQLGPEREQRLLQSTLQSVHDRAAAVFSKTR